MRYTNWCDDNLWLVHEWSNKNCKNPSDISRGSDIRVWWKCSLGHEWQATILNRIKGSNCPYCYGRMATDQTSLKYLRPNLALEWHPSKNGSRTPENTTSKTNKSIWWQCQDGHEWSTSAYNRTHGGTGCPYCKGKMATLDTSLLCKFPLIAKEWHPTNNFGADKVLPKSHKKVWWICPYGHEYQTSIASRTYSNTGCPHCCWQTSKIEIRIYCEIKTIFPEVIWQDKSLGFEIDIFLPKLLIGIEVDGAYWHKDRVEYDTLKSHKMILAGITPVRLRGEPMPLIGQHDISFKRGDSPTLTHSIVGSVMDKLETLSKIPIDYDRRIWLNDSEFEGMVRNRKTKKGIGNATMDII